LGFCTEFKKLPLFQTGLISKLVVISAVFASMMLAEQYFS
jgi:hypothetical protein